MTSTPPPAAELQPPAPRLASVDTLRGLTILLMIFVNDLGAAAPAWMLHIQPPDADGMTLADIVFPAFLFIVGVSIPLAMERQFERGKSRRQILPHILTRTLGLLLMGLIGVNRSADTTLGGAAWGILAYTSIILAWCIVPKAGASRKVLMTLKAVGIVGVIAALAIFRREPIQTEVLFAGEVQQWRWLQTSWWGILGLIGWAYLTSSLLYLVVGRRREWLMGAMMLMLVGYVALSNGGFFTRVDDKPWLQTLRPMLDGLAGLLSTAGSYVDLKGGPGALAAISVAGSLLGTTLAGPQRISDDKSRIRWALMFTLGLFLGGCVFDTFAGVNKIAATPTWSLWCAAITCLTWVIVYRVMDVGGYVRWAIIVRPAGANPLIAYLLHPIIVLTFSLTGLWDELLWYKDSPQPWIVIVGSIVMALLVCALTGLIAKAGLRVRI